MKNKPQLIGRYLSGDRIIVPYQENSMTVRVPEENYLSCVA